MPHPGGSLFVRVGGIGFVHAKNAAKQHFFTRAITLDNVPDKLQGVSPEEHASAQPPLLENQQYRARDEAGRDSYHVQPEARVIFVALKPIFDGFNQLLLHVISTTTLSRGIYNFCFSLKI